MSNETTRDRVLRVLGDVVPELVPSDIKPAANLRDQLDLDSMDFLNFMVALHKEFGVDIPESEYRKFLTLDSCVQYIESAKAGKPC